MSESYYDSSKYRVYLNDPVSITGIKKPEVFVPFSKEALTDREYVDERRALVTKMYEEHPKDPQKMREAHLILVEVRKRMQSRPEPDEEWLASVKEWERSYFELRFRLAGDLYEECQQGSKEMSDVHDMFMELHDYMLTLPEEDREWLDLLKSWVGASLYELRNRRHSFEGYREMIEGLQWLRASNSMGCDYAHHYLEFHYEWFRLSKILQRVLFDSKVRLLVLSNIRQSFTAYRALLADIKRNPLLAASI